MSNVLMDKIVKELGLNYGEFFAVKGHTHGGGIRNGREFNLTFIPYKLCKALWEKDKTAAIKIGSTTHLVIDESDFHAICCGMLRVVKASDNEKQFVYGYDDKNKKIGESIEQGNLF